MCLINFGYLLGWRSILSSIWVNLKPYHEDMEDPFRGILHRILTIITETNDKEVECILVNREVHQEVGPVLKEHLILNGRVSLNEKHHGSQLTNFGNSRITSSVSTKNTRRRLRGNRWGRMSHTFLIGQNGPKLPVEGPLFAGLAHWNFLDGLGLL